MANKSFKPEGYPALLPYMTVQNAAKSIEFYRDAFGFNLNAEPVMEKGNILHVEMKLNEALLWFSPEGKGSLVSKAKTPLTMKAGIQGINLYIYVPDVDQHCKQAKLHGARITMPVDNMFWGDRMYQAECLNGYMWSFATKVQG